MDAIGLVLSPSYNPQFSDADFYDFDLSEDIVIEAVVLEYDHVIILDPTAYGAQELYVALTRGSRSVTVISESSTRPAVEIAKYKEKQKGGR